MFLCNIGNHLQDYMASQPRPRSIYFLPWEPCAAENQMIVFEIYEEKLNFTQIRFQTIIVYLKLLIRKVYEQLWCQISLQFHASVTRQM